MSHLNKTIFCIPLQVVECVARTDVAQYDLTSLVRTSDNWEAAHGANGKFYINVCRSLNLVPGCSGTAAVCLKENNKVTNLGELCRGFQRSKSLLEKEVKNQTNVVILTGYILHTRAHLSLVVLL